MATLNLKKKKFIDEDALKKIVAIGINFGERLNSIETSLIAEYDSTKTYIIGEACYHDNYIYKCKSTATGEWNPDRWTLIGDDITELTLDEIKAMLGLTTEEIDTLSKIILDSEVRLDKTYSSSKIYTSIQDAIDTAKAYTLAEIGKASGASYKIASSTSDMTDEKVIYLLQNGSTYDMYIVDSGTPTRIGDVSIDLSDYYTKTEINNDFLKKTDATSTYATKTEVNDKVDKARILSATSSTATDDNLYSAKLLNGELDKKVNVTDISKIINETSTDDTIPTNKAVYDITKYNTIGLECPVDKSPLEFALENTTQNKIVYFTSWGNTSGYGKDNYATYVSIMHKDFNRISLISIDDKGEYNINTYSYGDWLGWKKVCTTSVADVPVTNIAPSDTTTFVGFKGNSDCNYCVKNGVCYVSIWNVKIASTGRTIRTGVILPKSANNREGALLTGNGDATPHAFVFIGNTGELCFDVKDANANLYGSFSYPVTES